MDEESWVVYRLGMYTGEVVVSYVSELRKQIWVKDGVWHRAEVELLAEGLTEDDARRLVQLTKETNKC